MQILNKAIVLLICSYSSFSWAIYFPPNFPRGYELAYKSFKKGELSQRDVRNQLSRLLQFSQELQEELRFTQENSFGATARKKMVLSEISCAKAMILEYEQALDNTTTVKKAEISEDSKEQQSINPIATPVSHPLYLSLSPDTDHGLNSLEQRSKLMNSIHGYAKALLETEVDLSQEKSKKAKNEIEQRKLEKPVIEDQLWTLKDRLSSNEFKTKKEAEEIESQIERLELKIKQLDEEIDLLESFVGQNEEWQIRFDTIQEISDLLKQEGDFITGESTFPESPKLPLNLSVDLPQNKKDIISEARSKFLNQLALLSENDQALKDKIQSIDNEAQITEQKLKSRLLKNPIITQVIIGSDKNEDQKITHESIVEELTRLAKEATYTAVEIENQINGNVAVEAQTKPINELLFDLYAIELTANTLAHIDTHGTIFLHKKVISQSDRTSFILTELTEKLVAHSPLLYFAFYPAQNTVGYSIFAASVAYSIWSTKNIIKRKKNQESIFDRPSRLTHLLYRFMSFRHEKSKANLLEEHFYQKINGSNTALGFYLNAETFRDGIDEFAKRIYGENTIKELIDLNEQGPALCETTFKKALAEPNNPYR